MSFAKPGVSGRPGRFFPMSLLVIISCTLFVALRAPYDGGGSRDTAGSLSGEGLSVAVVDVGTPDSFSWQNGVEGEAVTYSVSAYPEMDGITVDAETGGLTIEDSIPEMEHAGTVLARGTHDYTGKGERSAAVDAADFGSLTWWGYNDRNYLRILKGKAFTSNRPEWRDADGNPAKPTATYAVDPATPLPAGFSIDPDTGEISATVDGPERQIPSGHTIVITGSAPPHIETRSETVSILVMERAGNRAELLTMIGEEITSQGTQTPNLDCIDVSSVTEMDALFMSIPGVDLASFNPDVSEWNVGNVTNMSSMFYGAMAFNGEISGWDVSSVTDMSSMFDGYYDSPTNRCISVFNQDISGWDVSNVTDMNRMFRGATSFNQNLSTWNVGSVTDMSYMFCETTSFNGKISSWDVSSVSDMSYMFLDATLFNQNLNTWNVENVTNMVGMFPGAVAFNGDISGWDVSRVTCMVAMFEHASSFNQDISGWNVSEVTAMESMFRAATAFNQNLDTWGTHFKGRMVTMDNMFKDSGLESTPPDWYTP